MKKVAIIGASGMAGSEIFKLANQNKELDVTGIVRNQKKAEQVLGSQDNLLIGDVLTMDSTLLKRFDVIVDAFGTTPADAEKQVTLAKKLVEIAKDSDQRLIFILGAGSLKTGADQHYFVEDIAKTPGAEEWINTPKKQLAELQYLRGVSDVDWVGISPSAEFEPGSAGKYVIGGNDLLFNAEGESRVTAGTMAEVIVNEILTAQHHRERITVVNA